MATQSYYWSQAAKGYDDDFIDPYRDDVKNPLLGVLEELARGGARCVGDLGCGTGPLLPFLADWFVEVHAVDFAPGMLRHARKRCSKPNITFHEQPLTNLAKLHGKLDVAAAVNSLVMPDIRDLEKSLKEIHATLRPGGTFLAIVPAMDAVHYVTMLLLDRALDKGLTPEAARKNAAQHGDHALYDFAFGGFRYKGLDQHFWQPFEVRHRLERTGFQLQEMSQVLLSWEQFAYGNELNKYPPSWDWFFRAEKPK